MATISQRNTGSVWDKRARYIEQSTSALQRYVAMGDVLARNTKMKEYTPQQAQEADVSLYGRLLRDEQKTGPGKMPERSSGVAHTSETTGWGKRHLAISGVSHQPYVQTAHHSNAIGPGGSGMQSDGSGDTHSTTQNTYSQSQNTASSSAESGQPSSTPMNNIKIVNPTGPPGTDQAGPSSSTFPGFQTFDQLARGATQVLQNMSPFKQTGTSPEKPQPSPEKAQPSPKKPQPKKSPRKSGRPKIKNPKYTQ